MKSIRIVVLLSLLVLFTGAAANAQVYERIFADVPFDFVVSGHTLKSGEYDLGRTGLPQSVLKVQNLDTRKAVAGITQNIIMNGYSEDTKLVFRRYTDDTGDAVYFLAEVWVKGANTGVEFPKSSAEKAAEKGAFRRDMITLIASPARLASR